VFGLCVCVCVVLFCPRLISHSTAVNRTISWGGGGGGGGWGGGGDWVRRWGLIRLSEESRTSHSSMGSSVCVCVCVCVCVEEEEEEEGCVSRIGRSSGGASCCGILLCIFVFCVFSLFCLCVSRLSCGIGKCFFGLLPLCVVGGEKNATKSLPVSVVSVCPSLVPASPICSAVR